MMRTQNAVLTAPVPLVMERTLLVVLLALATGLGAYVEVPLPFTPVPLTLQTLFVLLGATMLPAAWGMGANALYLGGGAVGAVFFAGGAVGMAHLSGPSAGYLWAFLPAAFLVSKVWPRCDRFASRILLLALADALILAVGALWLGLFLHISPLQALLLGVLPFLPGEALKIAAVAGLGPLVRR